MINLHDIRHARLGTCDSDSAIAFATSIIGLQLVAREGKSTYSRSGRAEVRGDPRDHALVYSEIDPTVGTDLLDPEDLDARSAGAGRPAGVSRHAGGVRCTTNARFHRHPRSQRQQDRIPCVPA
ncbi:MAG: hypothetical protein ACREFY_10595 [Acetobacteraceae bacterium]